MVIDALGDDASDGFPRVAPRERGIDSHAIATFLDEAALLGVEFNSFMLWRSGAIVSEGWWWPYGPARKHMMHSATKSFLSAAVGFAVQEGYFALTDRVLDFFPEHAPVNPGAHLAEMTVEDLITQTSGHSHGTSGAQWRSIATSWIAEFLKIAVPYRPGEKFRYSSATSFMLSAIITKTTGDNAHNFLRPRLLEPLGIEDFTWDIGPENINPGGNGASCTTAALLKLAVLHHHKGRWNGVQLLPEQWIANATTPKRGNPYGYHWWVGPRDTFYAYGVFGQFAVVFPAHDAILVTTSATPYGEDTLRSLIWSHFPALLDQLPGPDAEARDQALSQRLNALSLLPGIRPSTSWMADRISGARFETKQNADSIAWFELHFGDGQCTLTVQDAKGRHEVAVGLSDWLESETTMSGAPLHHGYEPDALRVVAGGHWIEPTVFEMTWQFVETSFRDRVRLRFDPSGDDVVLERDVNTNTMNPVRPPVYAQRIA